jgi:anti-sigma factor RsiW
MICLRENEQGADLLIGYLEGTLPEAERAELERHAAACMECRGLLEVQQELDDLPAPEVSPDFDARLYARIAGEEQAKVSVWWRKLLWRPLAPLAAAAAVAVVLLLKTQAPAPVQDPPKQAAVDPQVELIEQVLEDMELLMPLGPAPGDVL